MMRHGTWFILAVLLVALAGQLVALEATGATGGGRDELDLPEIVEMAILGGSEPRSIDLKDSNVLTDEGFAVRVSDNVTAVSMFYIPSGSGDVKIAYELIGQQTGPGQFQVQFDFTTALGRAYFLVYRDDVAFKSAEFSVYKEGE